MLGILVSHLLNRYKKKKAVYDFGARGHNIHNIHNIQIHLYISSSFFLGTRGSIGFSSFLMKWSRMVVVVIVAHAIDSSCVDVGVSSAAFDPSSRLRRLLSHHSHQKRLFRQQLHPR